MNFNSLAYFLFLPFTVAVYFSLRPKHRNLFLLSASYCFYMNWNVRYGVLIFLSTLTTYVCGLFMDRNLLGKRKLWFVLNLAVNFSILFFFKYFNFFSQLAGDTYKLFNPSYSKEYPLLGIILPVGISFYTFQAVGYTFDVYRKQLPAEKNFIDYALFVSFFPQLVAGPIERSANLLPQFKPVHKPRLENLRAGLPLILWGLFKKTVIADRLAVLVNFVYKSPPGSIPAAGYIISAAAFSFQIYCDFSAYSDIAGGSAKMLGFTLMKNFSAPYLSSSVKEFWRRWHISLSAWFKDYLYFPLGGNRCSKLRNYLNVLTVFTVSGLWHGASLTFVFWGLLHGVYQVTEDALASAKRKIFKRRDMKRNIFSRLLGTVLTFSFVTYAFIFFRAETVTEALGISKIIFSAANLKALSFSCITELGLSEQYLWVLAAALALLITVDFVSGFKDVVKKLSGAVFLRYAACAALVVSVIVFGYYGTSYDAQEFIYFRF